MPAADKTLQAIRKKLKHCTLAWQPTLWLDTGIPELNCVIGHRDKGLPYGSVVEISGWQSAGKTAITMTLCALAQQDGAHIVWGGFEDRNIDERWASIRGLDLSKNFTPIVPYVGTFDNEKIPRLATAQELLEEMEGVMAAKHGQCNRMVVVIDSVAALLPEGEAEAGLTGGGFRSNMDLPMMMGRLLRRWVGLAQWYNCAIILINQLRTNPMARFGDRTYTPGGNASLFYSHVRLRVRRVGKIIDKGKMIGVRGIIKAVKNKAGGCENSEVGYRLFFNAPTEFASVSAIKKESGVEGEDA